MLTAYKREQGKLFSRMSIVLRLYCTQNLTNDSRSRIVNHLIQSFQQEDIGIAGVYFSYKGQEDQTVVNLIASLLQQLVQRNHVIPDEIKSTYQYHIKKQTRP